MRGWEVMLAILIVTAGCFSAGEPPADRTDDAADAQQPPWTTFRPPVNVSTEQGGAEPVVATASDGMLFVQAKAFVIENVTGEGFVNRFRSPNHVWRSTDRGATWTDVTPPDLGENGSADGFVTVGADDTVYVANALGPTTPPIVGGTPAPPTPGHTLQLFRSSDLGDTWERLAPPQVPGDVHRMWIVPANGTLHMTLATLGADPDTRPLYHVSSSDGGETWTAPTVVHETRSFGSDLALGPDGSLFIVIWTPDGSTDFTLARSTDGGETFETLGMVDGAPRESFASSWQSLEVGPNGTLSLAWAQAVDGRAQVRYTVSTDRGERWTSPRTLAQSPGGQLLPWSSASGSGSLDAVWIQEAEDGGANATWYPTLARVQGLSNGDPDVHVSRLSPWPIHEGEVCVAGYCSGEGGSRAMADFTWIDHGPEGLAHAAFASTQADPNAVPVYIGETAPPER